MSNKNRPEWTDRPEVEYKPLKRRVGVFREPKEENPKPTLLENVLAVFGLKLSDLMDEK